LVPSHLGEHVGEGFKGGVHLAIFALAAVCAAYNAGTALARRDRRLTLQAAGYAGLALWEAQQIRGHWGSGL
jgi:type II secretory pathway pseudopilin PulG